MYDPWPMRRRPPVLATLLALTIAVGAAGAPSLAHAEGPEPTHASTPPAASAESAAPAESHISSPGLAIGGAAVGIFGLGATGLGVFLTAKGSTLECPQCSDTTDEAPLVVGGLAVVVLGLGLAAAGGTMTVLGLRDAPTGVHVAELRAGPGTASIVGSF